MVTSMKKQNLLELIMFSTCSCLTGPSSGKLTVYSNQLKRPEQDFRRQKENLAIES